MEKWSYITTVLNASPVFGTCLLHPPPKAELWRNPKDCAIFFPCRNNPADISKAKPMFPGCPKYYGASQYNYRFIVIPATFPNKKADALMRRLF